MKYLPGIKIVCFIAVVSSVALAVFVWAQATDRQKIENPKYIVKFGSEASMDQDLVDYQPDELKHYFKHHGDDPAHPDQGKDKKNYKIRHYVRGSLQKPADDDGDLATCFDPPKDSAEPGPSPKSAKTQTAGTAGFADAAVAADFLRFLEAGQKKSSTEKKPGR
ncbi:MAG: hypothetical protein ACJ8M1_06230 [Chthoniobacterales bacterium]|jgi:hypothetical protein